MPSTSGYMASASYGRTSPVIRKTSTAYSQTSEEDRNLMKRKVSFCHTTDTDSDSDYDRPFSDRESSSQHERKNPPPRKYAAAVLQFDDKLMEIRKEEERKRSERSDEGGECDGKMADEEPMKERSAVARKVARIERGTVDSEDQQSHTLPSPLFPRAMSPPSVILPVKPEGGKLVWIL